MTIFWVTYNSLSFVLNCVAPSQTLDAVSMEEDIVGETSRSMHKENVPRYIMESRILSSLCEN